MDYSVKPEICFYCDREDQVKIQLEKWVKDNPIYKPSKTDSLKLKLLKEMMINTKESNLRQQMQPQPREQNEYNKLLANYDCLVKLTNKNSVNPLICQQDIPKNNVLSFNKSQDKNND